MLESPELGVEFLQQLQEKEGKLEFQHAITFSQCLVETGQFSKAKNILQQLIKEDTAEDWKEIIKSRIESIENLKDDSLSPDLYETTFGIRGGGFQGRMEPILQYWQSGKDIEHLQKLARMFKAVQDDYGNDLVLEIIAGAEIKCINRNDSADAMLELGNNAHKAKDDERAFKLWRQIENDYNDTKAWPKAVFNIGIALKAQKKFDSAIDEFKKLLIADVNNDEPGTDIA